MRNRIWVWILSATLVLVGWTQPKKQTGESKEPTNTGQQAQSNAPQPSPEAVQSTLAQTPAESESAKPTEVTQPPPAPRETKQTMTGNKEISFPAESVLTFRLSRSIKITHNTDATPQPEE